MSDSRHLSAPRVLPLLIALFLLAPGPVRAVPAAEAEQPAQAAALPGDDGRATHFGRAAGEVLMLEAIPWAASRFVTNADFARISAHTISENFKHGFHFDNDAFKTNQFDHVFHGTLFFNAGRTNGYSFWHSVPFALAGSLTWEYCMETQRPSPSDLVNTTIGGTTMGEITYRLSNTLLQPGPSGRVGTGREIFAALLNPVSAFNRLLMGQTGTPERPIYGMKPALDIELRAGIKYNGQGSSNSALRAKAGGGLAAGLDLRYSDPYDFPLKRPFDYFEAGAELNTHSHYLVEAIKARGLLATWQLPGENGDYFTAPGLTYEYYNDGRNAFSGQSVNFSLFSRWKKNESEIRLETMASGYPLAAIGSDYPKLNTEILEKFYEYGSGGGGGVDLRLRRGGFDRLIFTWAAGWFNTVNGLSDSYEFHRARAEGRLPLSENIYAGLALNMTRHKAYYSGLPDQVARRTRLSLFAVMKI